MATVMEYLEHLLIQQLFPNEELDLLEELEVEVQLRDFVDVKQEHVVAVVELNEFDEAALSQFALDVYRQYLALEDGKGTPIE